MSVLTIPTCPEGCDDLQPTLFNECAPELHYGRIAKIYVGSANTTSFANVDQITEWTARLGNTPSPANSKLYPLVVIGNLPEPDQNEIEISGDRTAVGFKQFTLNFRIDETNDTNYRFLMALECNLKHTIWYETADGMLYGGNDGIKATLRLNQVIPESQEEHAVFVGTAKWKSQFAPLRCKSPMV